MIMESALPKRSQAIIVARENIVSKVVDEKNKVQRHHIKEAGSDSGGEILHVQHKGSTKINKWFIKLSLA